MNHLKFRFNYRLVFFKSESDNSVYLDDKTESIGDFLYLHR